MNTSLSQLLVHFDSSEAAAKRLRAACELARKHQAAVTALYAVTSTCLMLPTSAELGPSVEATLRQLDDQRCAEARARFDQVVASADVPTSWAQLGGYDLVEAFGRQALYADLMVLGQYDASDPETGNAPADFIESVTLTSGKPALVLPYAITPKTLGETLVVAWKPTREAARAVAAAMPLLQRARRVHVVSWGMDDVATEGDALNLDGYLKRYGVEAAWHREARQADELGELLLSRVFDLEADLLVMGCYGHSRAREWVLGGVSRTVLRSMTLPVLLAH